MIENLSPVVRERFIQHLANAGETALSSHELFLHSFCHIYKISGEVRSTPSNKFYFVIKHPTFILESQNNTDDYMTAVNECIDHCDIMLRSLFAKEKQIEQTTSS